MQNIQNTPLVSKSSIKSPATWIPTLYFMEALPYVVVNTMSVIMYKELELTNTDIALYTSLMYLPWVIKPVWSPIVDSIATEKKWVLWMQLLCALAFTGIAFTITSDFWLQASIAFLWIIAFCSSTHDIAADGYYIVALNANQQAFYVGIRSTCYRIGMIFGQGLLVMFAGWLQNGAPLSSGEHARKLIENPSVNLAWAITFFVMAIIALALMLYHSKAMPKVEKNQSTDSSDTSLIVTQQPYKNKNSNVVLKTLKDFASSFIVFFSKKNIVAALLFMLLFRLPEALLVKIASPFMLDSMEKGGLALSTEFVGFIYGTVGVVGLLAGGIIGGALVAKQGLAKWLWPMVIAISLPDAAYIYLSATQTSNSILIATLVAIEQFGYGFGFTAYMMYLIYFAKGEKSTSVYALCTAFMALGMMLPGMIAGKISDLLGYQYFFILVTILCSVTFIVSAFLKIDKNFGKKITKESN